MGIARLLAKGWTVVCLFAAAHAMRLAVLKSAALPEAFGTIAVCALLFVAMGLVFILGYAAASDHGNAPFLPRFKASRLVPSFDDAIFALFVSLSFYDQAVYAPAHMQSGLEEALRAAMHFAVPGQRALETALACGLNDGRIFASAFAWLLAAVYLASAASRLRLTAGLLRLERNRRPEALGPIVPAAVLGVTAVLGVQLLFMGTAFDFVPCWAYTETSGSLLIGLAPLLLAYLIVAALTTLKASAPEG